LPTAPAICGAKHALPLRTSVHHCRIQRINFNASHILTRQYTLHHPLAVRATLGTRHAFVAQRE
jgi:hypothetical protein